MLESHQLLETFYLDKAMKLFLCNTPLQAMIAARIIDEEGLSLHECSLLYVCDGLNDKIHSSFVRLSSFMKYAKLIHRARSLSGVRRMRKFISSIGNVDEIYVACIDDSLAHYAISFTKGATIKTFDDGTANITPSSRYFTGRSGLGFRSALLKAFHALNGNRYNLKLVKSESVLHYSIYNGFDNVMDNVKHIELIGPHEIKSKVCSVFTGVNYTGYCKSKDYSDALKERVRIMLGELQGDVIYIPFDMEDRKFFVDHVIDRDLIAEEIVMSIIDRYEMVYLYGFADLPQNLFMDKKNVTVMPVCSSELIDDVVSCVNTLSYRSGSDVVIV